MAKLSKYIAWEKFFAGQSDESVTVSLEALRNILDGPMPVSANQRTWWANTQKAPQAKAWMSAGYMVSGFLGNAVTFTRAELIQAEPAKRRGRPPKSGDGAPKKRGRPAKKRGAPAPVQEKAAELRVALLGTGNLGSAILQGVAKSRRVSAKAFMLYDKDAEKAKPLAKKYKTGLAESAAEALEGRELLLLAVKPGNVEAALEEIQAGLEEVRPLVISAAAGWTLSDLEAVVPEGTALARIMPNLNAAVGQSATVYSVNGAVTEEQKAALTLLLEAFGSAREIDESRFGAHLALSGAGPAFVYLFADALARAGVRLGLPRDEALAAAVQTLLGSAETLKASALHPQELVDRVCSPGGITIEGVLALEETGFAASVAGAVSAAFEKNLAL